MLAERRAQWPWLDHLVRGAGRYNAQKGDYYAAGITYFSVLALFPLLMVAFAAAGFVLGNDPELLTTIRDDITSNVPGGLGDTLNTLIDSAIKSRTTVGVIGLVGALYAGLGWIANLRAALTAMWETQSETSGFLMTKLHDLGAMIGLAVALAVSLGLSALNAGGLMKSILALVNLDNVPGVSIALRIVAIVIAVAASWGVFIWVIARLPREPVPVRSAVGAALVAAIAFEIFKQVATVYLTSITSGPAGAVFGPIIGILVFVFITSRLVLFATALAATSDASLRIAVVAPPDPAIIESRVEVHEGPSIGGGLALVGAGALAALGIGGLRNRRSRK